MSAAFTPGPKVKRRLMAKELHLAGFAMIRKKKHETWRHTSGVTTSLTVSSEVKPNVVASVRRAIRTAHAATAPSRLEKRMQAGQPLSYRDHPTVTYKRYLTILQESGGMGSTGSAIADELGEVVQATHTSLVKLHRWGLVQRRPNPKGRGAPDRWVHSQHATAQERADNPLNIPPPPKPPARGETRAKMLAMLEEQSPRTLRALAEHVGITSSSASTHMKKLTEAGQAYKTGNHPKNRVYHHGPAPEGHVEPAKFGRQLQGGRKPAKRTGAATTHAAKAARKAIVMLLQATPGLTYGQVANAIPDCSDSTVGRQLKDLVDKGKVHKAPGENKRAAYYFGPAGTTPKAPTRRERKKDNRRERAAASRSQLLTLLEAKSRSFTNLCRALRKPESTVAQQLKVLVEHGKAHKGSDTLYHHGPKPPVLPVNGGGEALFDRRVLADPLMADEPEPVPLVPEVELLPAAPAVVLPADPTSMVVEGLTALELGLMDREVQLNAAVDKLVADLKLTRKKLKKISAARQILES